AVDEETREHQPSPSRCAFREVRNVPLEKSRERYGQVDRFPTRSRSSAGRSWPVQQNSPVAQGNRHTPCAVTLTCDENVTAHGVCLLRGQALNGKADGPRMPIVRSVALLTWGAMGHAPSVIGDSGWRGSTRALIEKEIDLVPVDPVDVRLLLRWD